MKAKVSISYSRDDMDSWGEGRKTEFVIQTPVLMSKYQLANIGEAYLQQLGVEYREFMTKVEITLDDIEELD